MNSLEPVSYRHGDTALTGWLARCETRPRGAIVIYPTIANVNDHIRRRAAMLAQAGFMAMIADFYGEEVRDFVHAGELGAALRSDPHAYRARLLSAIGALRSHPAAGGLPVGVIGYCMGGGAALEAARSGEELVIAASFHGLLETPLPAQPGQVRARLLVCHGDADPMVPREHVMRFWQEMDAAGALWHFHSYSGVKHGFTDTASDTRGLPALAYDASANRQSWAALMAMCDELFG